jgi:hypothetical protein
LSRVLTAAGRRHGRELSASDSAIQARRDSGASTSSAANAPSVRERAAQEISPKIGRMGAEDPSTVSPAGPQKPGGLFL